MMSLYTHVWQCWYNFFLYSCHESQDIANNGSTTIDRSCKAKIKINLPAIKLTTENNIDNSDKNNSEYYK